jgi:hypothetical protein
MIQGACRIPLPFSAGGFPLFRVYYLPPIYPPPPIYSVIIVKPPLYIVYYGKMPRNGARQPYSPARTLHSGARPARPLT